MLAAAAGARRRGGGRRHLGQLLGRGASPEAVTLPAAAETLTPLPTGLENTVRGISAFRTPNADFYRIDTALVIPRVSTDGWKLTIDGDVDRPYSLTFDELLAMPLVERDITLTCVSNEVGGPYIGARPLARGAHSTTCSSGPASGPASTRSSATPPTA